MKISLLSTVIVPSFDDRVVKVIRLSEEKFLEMLGKATDNFCGHPLTMNVLSLYAPNLPEAIRGRFWDGEGIGIAARPKGGVRNAKETGDTAVGSLGDLEFCMFVFVGSFPWGYEGMAKAADAPIVISGEDGVVLWAGPGLPRGAEVYGEA